MTRHRQDFLDEEPTPREPMEQMGELMETLRSPGIPTSTSEVPTRPIRARIIDRSEVP